MSAGKYSPHVRKGEFVGVQWKTGTLGYPVELADDGYDWYGYNENGRDVVGKSEDDYLLEDIWLNWKND
jgi:hypothetical protein